MKPFSSIITVYSIKIVNSPGKTKFCFSMAAPPIMRIAQNPADRVLVQHVNLGERIEPTFPSEYFATHEGRPELRLRPSTLTLPQLRDMAHAGIMGNNLNVDIAMRYILMAVDARPVVADSPWVSFTRNIAATGGNVGLSNIFAIVEAGDPLVPVDTPVISPDFDVWMIRFVCGIYRICIIDRQDYRANTIVKIHDRMTAHQAPNNITPAIIYGYYSSWMNNRTYRKIITGLDMYLHKYRSSEFADCRIGTYPGSKIVVPYKIWPSSVLQLV